jgi:hypothetical protein
VLWPDGSPSEPPTHRHSDWFPDPQTRPAADALAKTIRGSPRALSDLGVRSESGSRHDEDEQSREHDEHR